MKKILLLAFVSSAALSGCLSKTNFETEPVTIQTQKGQVICQLYTGGRVMWDEALAFPQDMPKEQADQYCLAEGDKRAAHGVKPIPPGGI